MNGRLRVGAAALGLAFVIAIAVGTTGVLTPTNERVALGASTTLGIINGSILVRHGTGDYGPAEDGAILGPGDMVKTGADARAVLTYFEGSTVEIEPNSELTIETAHANPDGSTVIVMRQDLGTTWHVVTHLLSGGSKYEVHTTAATASVRGTQFTVSVDPDGTTTETTTEGVVADSDAAGTSTVLTPPGMQTTTKSGETPAPPQPAPEPERKVTVTVGDQNSIVVDTLGRANGIKDGKKILQTPGAQLEIVDGHLVVTLPNIPDGTLSTRFGGTSGSTDVTGTVTERGTSAVTMTGTVQATSNTGLVLKRSDGSNAPSAEKKPDQNNVPSSSIGEAPTVPTGEPAVAAASDGPGKNATSGATDSNSTGPGIVPVALPPIAPGSDSAGNSSGNGSGTAPTSGNGSANPPDAGPANSGSGSGGASPSTDNASSSNGPSTATSPINGNANPAGPAPATSGGSSPSTGNAGTSNGPSTGTPPGSGNANPAGPAPATSGGGPATSGSGAAKGGGTFTGNAGAILKDVLKDVVKSKPSK